MKKHPIFTCLLLAFAAFVTMAFTVMAQPPMMERLTPESRIAEMDTVLTLSDDQKTQILKIYTDAESNAPQSGPGPRGQGGRGPQGSGFMGGQTDAAVEKVLTPEQVTAWRAYTLGQSVDRRIAQIDAAVSLTDSQKTQIRPVIEKEITAQTEMRTQMQSGGVTREDIRVKMTEIREATAKSLKSILTGDQLEKYTAMPRGGMRRQ